MVSITFYTNLSIFHIYITYISHIYICHICDILQLCTWQNIYMRFPGSQTCLVQFIFNELCCMEWNLARKCIFHFFLSFSLLHHIHICVTWLGKIYMSFSRSGIISDLVWELTSPSCQSTYHKISLSEESK